MTKKEQKETEVVEEVKTEEAQPALEFPKVLLIVAMESERDKIVKPALEKLGLLGRTDIWVATTGVGKVSATLSTTLALLSANSADPSRLKELICVNVGVCGGNKEAAEGFPCVQINKVCNNDFDTSAVDGDAFEKQVITLTSEVENMRTCFSQDHFCTDPAELPSDGEPYYVDMELFGIASACAQLGIRLTSLKSVCDVIGGEQKEQYEGINFDVACARCAQLLEKYLSTSSDVVLT